MDEPSDDLFGKVRLLASRLATERNGKESLRLFLHGLYGVADQRVLVLLSPSPPAAGQGMGLAPPNVARAIALLCDYQEASKALEKTYQEEQARIRGDVSFSEEAKKASLLGCELKWAEKANSLIQPRLSDLKLQLQRVGFIVPLPKRARDKTKAIIRTISSSGISPPRDGMYECTAVRTCKLEPAALVRWVPRGDITPALEVKAALEQKRPSAFARPRLTGRHPPTFESDEEGVLARAAGIAQGWPRQEEAELADRLPRPLDDGRGSFSARGFEAIAWYQSFHRYEEEFWGIHFAAGTLDTVVADFASDVQKRRLSRLPRTLAATLMFEMTLAHELFHARADFICAWLELATSKKHYLPYKKNIYDALRFTEDWREEALANWVAHQWLMTNVARLQGDGLVDDIAGLQSLVADWLDFSPEGYRRWRDGNTHDAWDRLGSELTHGRPCPRSSTPLSNPLGEVLRAGALIDLHDCDVPSYWVGRGVVADMLFSSPAREEIVGVLKHFGYRLLSRRGKGSHQFWEGPGGRGFTLPKRDPLSVGVFHELLEHFGWTKRQYMEDVRSRI
ncbi:MAG: type II toxin-antitoxin system HicA family toxin [Myxococcota bacterium]|nr:type II toxin-antitoxin system HicA family toxin [Myxococcota bacterium]